MIVIYQGKAVGMAEVREDLAPGGDALHARLLLHGPSIGSPESPVMGWLPEGQPLDAQSFDLTGENSAYEGCWIAQSTSMMSTDDILIVEGCIINYKKSTER